MFAFGEMNNHFFT